MAAGIAVAAVALLLSVRDIKRRRLSRWFDSLFYLALGLAGCVIAFLVFVSTHYASSPNWLLLWINPLCLLIAICIWLRRTYPLLRILQSLNVAVIVIYLLLIVFGPVRTNPAFFPFIFADTVRAITFISVSRNVITKKVN